MSSMTLRRIAIITTILTVLVAIDGIYMLVTHYNQGETQNYNLPDGATVLIAAGLLLVFAIVAFALSIRASRTEAEPAVKTETEPEVKAQDA